GLATFLVLAIVGGLIAVQQRQDAVREQRVSVSQRIAAQATALATSRPEVSLLLRAAAYRIAPTGEARRSLLDGLAGQPFSGALTGTGGTVFDVAFSANGRFLASEGNGRVRLWDIQRRKLLAATSLLNLPEQVETDATRGGVAFSPDGRILAIGGSETTPDATKTTDAKVVLLRTAGL